MEKKKLLRLLGGISLVLTLVAVPLMAACAEPAPPPPPAPKPAPAPAPKPAPAPPPAPAPKPITNKLLLGGRVGDPWFVTSQALAYFVNRQSDWLRLEVVATPGVDAGPEIAMEDPGKYIFTMANLPIKYFPRMGKFKYYNKMRIIGLGSTTTWVWVTYDKEVKTAQDFVGKKVFLGRKGGSRFMDEMAVLEELGVLDEVTIAQGGYGGGKTALKDGLVDIGVMIIDHIYPAGFSKGALIEDMETRKPVYYPNIMPAELQEKIELIPGRMYPGALDAKTQPEELWCSVIPVFWGADERQDEDIVYEVTRILYENAGEFTAWHAQGASMTEEFIPTYVYGKKWVHLAALKYYEEHGIEVKDLAKLLR